MDQSQKQTEGATEGGMIRSGITFLRRRRRSLLPTFYLALICASLVLLYDPSYMDSLFSVYTKTEAEVRQVEASTPRAWTMGRVLELPFVPRDFTCDEMHMKAGRNFTYPEGYHDHADAYKSALELNNLIEHAASNEQSWLIQDLAQLPFVRTVCETGFHAGHHAFHFLTANQDLVVHSFENLERFNFTLDMSDFMIIEFPDRFFIYPGDPASESIPKFIQERENTTECDVIFIDSSDRKETLKSHFRLFRRLANRREHVVIMNAHPKNVIKNANDADALWEEMKSEKSIKEHFRCYFDQKDVSANQMGLLVGSFVF